MSCNPSEQSEIENNPHVHMVNVNGANTMVVDAVSMIKETENFFNGILNNLILWHQSNPVHHFFISDNKKFICGVSGSIKFLKSNQLLSSTFKKDHLKVLDIPTAYYDDYSKLMVAEKEGKENSQYLSQLSCFKRMQIIKNIGNAIFKQNGCKLHKAAISLYKLGITQLQSDKAGEHESCMKSTNHNMVLSQLYNNMSVICLKEIAYEASAHYANKALRWNNNYEKCIKRLRYINNKLDLVD